MVEGTAMDAFHLVPQFCYGASTRPFLAPSLRFGIKIGFLNLPTGEEAVPYSPLMLSIKMKDMRSWGLQENLTTETPVADSDNNLVLHQRLDIDMDVDTPTTDISVAESDDHHELCRRLETNMDVASLACCLQNCRDATDRVAGEKVHAHIIGRGYESDTYLGNFLTLMYGSCCRFEAAQIVFHKIPTQNVYSWNIFINACKRNGRVDEAKVVFDQMPKRNVASWNAIIAAFSQHGYGNEALEHYTDMLDENLSPDKITFVSAIDACADLAALIEGMLIHCSVISSGYSTDVIVGTSLMYMYSRCGDLETATIIFQQIMELDIVCCNAMIEACIENDCNLEAFSVFDWMKQTGIESTRPTFLGMLDACANLAQLFKGREFHASIVSAGLDSDIMVENALINMYGKCNSLKEAMIIFCKMQNRDEVTWSTIIAGLEAVGRNKEALELFQQMQLESISPNKFTFSTLLDICAHQTDLVAGRQFHVDVVSTGTELDFILEIALINMYGRCGRLDDARAVFDRKFEHEIRSWNTKILACVLNGHDQQALQLFDEMQSKGILPNKITFKLIDDMRLPHT